jgi:hypothetical protein
MSDQTPSAPVSSNTRLRGGCQAPAIETDPTVIARELLEGAHEELLAAVLNAVSGGEPSINIKSLPPDSQRLVWRLYARHYPDLARWIQEMDMEAWRQQFGATLNLDAQDILRALERDDPQKSANT